MVLAGDPAAAVEGHHGRRWLAGGPIGPPASGPATPCTVMSSVALTCGGGTFARVAARGRSDSRALCGVMVAGSRRGNFVVGDV